MASAHVALPTHDGRMEITTLVQLLDEYGRLLGRDVQLHIGEAGNIPRARNLCLRLAEQAIRAENPNASVAWLLWVDSDIRLLPGAAAAMAGYVRRAESEGVAFTAHYRQADGRSTFSLGRGPRSGMLSTEAVSRLPDWAQLGTCGFGLLYAPIRFGYVFHADETGEDVHFWHEHPDLPLHFAKHVALKHHKVVLL